MGQSNEVFSFPMNKKNLKDRCNLELKNLQRINSNMKYYEDFNADLRTLNAFILKFNGNYEGNRKF